MQTPEAVREMAYERPERPPNYIVRSVVLAVLLVPLALLLGASKLVEVVRILFGPPVISEVPAWWDALMEMIKVLVALMGVVMPIIALFKSARVNILYNRGDYLGAESASKKAAYYGRQNIIILIVLIIVIATDVFTYLAS